MDLSQTLITAMADLNEDLVVETVRNMIAAGQSSEQIQYDLNTGIAAVGTRFEQGEYFIADLIVSGMIYRSALLEQEPLRPESAPRPRGKVIIGVVAGDIHDIGKDIIVSLLRAERFDVVDLGIDVKPERFIHAVRNYEPDILLLSGVLSTAQDSMAKTVGCQWQGCQSRDRQAVLPIESDAAAATGRIRDFQAVSGGWRQGEEGREVQHGCILEVDRARGRRDWRNEGSSLPAVLQCVPH